MELYALQAVLPEIERRGASLVALTPQLREHSRSMVEKHSLGFDILSDPGNAYAAKLGLRFQVPEDLKAVYQSFGIDLAKHGGEGSWTLPMPARFVVGRDGIIATADVDPDYTRRPEPQKTLDDLDALT